MINTHLSFNRDDTAESITQKDERGEIFHPDWKIWADNPGKTVVAHLVPPNSEPLARPPEPTDRVLSPGAAKSQTWQAQPLVSCERMGSTPLGYPGGSNRNLRHRQPPQCLRHHLPPPMRPAQAQPGSRKLYCNPTKYIPNLIHRGIVTSPTIEVPITTRSAVGGSPW